MIRIAKASSFRPSRRSINAVPLLLILGLFTAATAWAQAAGESAAVVLRPGDAVRIVVWERPDLSDDVVVSGDGYLFHPFYSTIRVDMLTLAQLEQRVGQRISASQANANFVIQPLFRVIVAGAVRQPGIKTLPPGTTVRQAILEAGGANELGVLNRARLIRDGSAQTIDLSTVSGAQLTVVSGDEIIVDRRRSILRDVIVPTSTIVGAVTSLVHIIWRLRN